MSVTGLEEEDNYLLTFAWRAINRHTAQKLKA